MIISYGKAKVNSIVQAKNNFLFLTIDKIKQV